MVKVTNAFDSYSAIGNKEDLQDVIYNIDPTDCPFMSMIGTSKATAVKHEWQTDTLAAADGANAQLEGDDITPAASTATTRLDNYCQISRREAAVTGTQEAVKKAGRGSEKGYQIAKRGKELKRDMETVLTQNQGYVAGNATTARKTRSLESWITTNDSRGAIGADGTPTTGATDGTQRPFTEALLKTVIQAAYTSGANPKVLMVGPFNKGVVSGFTGRSSARQNIGADKIQAAAHLYASDFGDIKVVPNRFQRERTAFVLDPEYVSVAYLRRIHKKDLATIGDAERCFLQAEYALCMKNEAAHGVVADLDAS